MRRRDLPANIGGTSGYIRLYSHGGELDFIKLVDPAPDLIACLPDARTTVFAGSRRSRIRIVCCAGESGTSSFACEIAEIVCEIAEIVCNKCRDRI